MSRERDAFGGQSARFRGSSRGVECVRGPIVSIKVQMNEEASLFVCLFVLFVCFFVCLFVCLFVLFCLFFF